MARAKLRKAGGWASIRYSLDMARKVGGVRKLYRALRSANTCKACAFGMGGIAGGMVNEAGQKWQVCKKSMQAQAQDMQPGIPADFFNQTTIDELKMLSGRELEALGRLVHPLYLSRDASRFSVLSWPQALELLVERWKHAQPQRSFFYTSGRSSMEAAFLIQLLARQWGTNNVNNCSYYCHQASGVGLTESLGSGTSTVTLEDLTRADLVVLIGANPASNHPRLMTFLMELRRRGGKVVVINPFLESGLQYFSVPSDVRSLLFGSEIANLYLQPHCGGDLALLKAAAACLWRENQADVAFMRAYCNGFQGFVTDLESEDMQRLVEISGVPMTDFETFCRTLSASSGTIFAWAMGITHHEHGVQNVQAIANLALLRGMVGRPGAGLLPIRGHSNVQGVGSVGVIPKLKPPMAKALLEKHGVQVPETEGKDTFACMQAAHDGEIDFSVLTGGNLYAANPDSAWAARALARIDFTAFLSTTLNLGHIHGHGKDTLILPVRARDEEKQSTSQESMFNYVRLSRGGQPAPAEDLPAESEIFVRVAQELFSDSTIPWQQMADHHQVRQFIASSVPSMAPMSELDSGKEFTIPGRIRHQPEFGTQNGKANLSVLSVPDTRAPQGYFNLMTLRSEGQFNTIIYEEYDVYRGVSNRMVVLMNQADIHKHGFAEGQQVIVESEVGRLAVELVVAPIRAGNVAMYFPEANALTPARIDPKSKTPAFKRVQVRISLAEKPAITERRGAVTA